MRSTIAAASLVAFAGGIASAQTEWASPGGGAWGVAGNWSPANVPDTAGETARILLFGTYEVTLTGAFGVGVVEVLNPAATISIQPGAHLAIVSGSLRNEGTILLNPVASASDSILSFTVNTLLEGSGVIRLNGVGLDARIEAQFGSVLTHDVGHTIAGRGRLLGLMTNESDIIADIPGSFLEIGATLTQTGAGMCLADGGSLGLPSGGRINGGVIDTINGGVWATLTGSSLLDGVQNLGSGEVSPGTVLRIESGGLVNNGNIVVNTSAAPSDAVVDLLSSATLSGTGTLRLNGVSLDAQLTTQVGQTLTNESTIAGRGRISATTTNDGVINADFPAGVLEVNGIITQTAAGECRADGGFLGLINGGSITGGILDSSGDGRWLARSGLSTVEDVHNLGSGQVGGSATLDLLGGGMVNDGDILVNPTAAPSDAVFRVAESSIIGGTGEIRLNGVSFDAQLTTQPGAVLTNGSDHTIAGRGRISATVSNEGTVAADVAGGVLEVAGVIAQAPGAQCRADEGFFGLVGGSISGGMTDSSGAGMVQARSSTSTIDGITNLGRFDVSPGGTLSVGPAGLENNGLMVINTTAAPSDAVMRYLAPAGLSGTGELRLGGVSLDAQLTTAPGASITHSADHTIAGFGRIAAEIDNAGLLNGDVAARNLEIAGAITQTASGSVRADGGTLGLVAGGALSGGLIDGTGAGSVEATSGTSTVFDTRMVGTFNIRSGASVESFGTIINDGALVLNPTGSPSDAVLQSTAPLLITGSGTISLSGVSLDSRLSAGAGAAITLGPAQTLRGIGRITGDIINQGTISPGLSVGTLFADGALTLASTSNLIIEVAAAAAIDSISGTAIHTLDGQVEVQQLGGFVPVLGQRFIIMTGSSFSGLFDDLVAPDLGGIEWKVVYFPTKVELQVRCKADLSGSSDPNHPDYGVPDGVRDASDFFYYLDLFVAQDPRADLTGSSDPNDPSYGVKDGVIDASDFFFFLDIFAGVCG